MTPDCSISNSEMQYGYPTPCSSPAEQIADPLSLEQSKPLINRLDSSQYPNEDDLVLDICRNLRISGGCIIRNMVDGDTLKALEGEIRPHLDRTEQADGENICQLLAWFITDRISTPRRLCPILHKDGNGLVEQVQNVCAQHCRKFHMAESR